MLNAIFFRTSDGHVIFYTASDKHEDSFDIMHEAARKLEGIDGSPPPDSPLQDSIIVEWATGIPAWEALDKYRQSLS